MKEITYTPLKTTPLFDSIRFSFKYLKNPWAIVPIFLNRSVKVDIKWSNDGGIVVHGKTEFWKLRNLTHRGWEIIDTRNGIVYTRKKDIFIAGYLHHLSVLMEPLESYYKVFDFRDKIVLDVGGYIGYSAVLFSKWGAKKVIIYEAQRKNIPVIRRNLELNKVNNEVYNLAVADRDGEIELAYEKLGSTDFGLGGNRKYRVKAVSVAKVLSQHSIDIAKFDCEGCEYSLLSVPCKILRKVPRYVIEYHHGFERLKNKFEDCGFSVKKLWRINSQVGGFEAEVNR